MAVVMAVVVVMMAVMMAVMARMVRLWGWRGIKRASRLAYHQ